MKLIERQMLLLTHADAQKQLLLKEISMKTEVQIACLIIARLSPDYRLLHAFLEILTPDATVFGHRIWA